MASETVRIRAETHAKLKALADTSGEPMPEVLDKAVEALRRERFLEQLNEDFARLRADKREWAEELAERGVWDKTVADGLKDE